MGISNFLSSSQVQNIVGTTLAGTVTGLAGSVGIDLGTQSPAAKAPKSVGGVPTQAPQAVFTAIPWYKKPIVVIVAGVAVAGLLWALLRKK